MKLNVSLYKLMAQNHDMRYTVQMKRIFIEWNFEKIISGHRVEFRKESYLKRQGSNEHPTIIISDLTLF